MERQTPKTNIFFYAPQIRVFDLTEIIALKSYSWVFVEDPQLPRFGSEKNITVSSSCLKLDFVCNGTFNIYALDATNFNNYVKNASYSAIATTKFEVSREMSPVPIPPHGKTYYWCINLNIPNNSSNIYIVFENPNNTHLFLELSAMPWAQCTEIEGYITEHLIMYDYAPIAVRNSILALVVLLIIVGLSLSVIDLFED